MIYYTEYNALQRATGLCGLMDAHGPFLYGAPAGL